MNKKINAEYPIRWQLQYVPTYYEGLDEEHQRDQHIVLDFKEGRYDENLMHWFKQNIWKLTEGDEYSWSVCFLPCSSEEVQNRRFGKLAEYLKETTRVEIHLSTFGFADRHEPFHQGGKSDIDVTNIAMHVPDIFCKNVVLIDDIITTGKTFNRTAEQAMRMGANSIHGLFLAKTIHPNLPKKEGILSRKGENETRNRFARLSPEHDDSLHCVSNTKNINNSCL